MAVLGAGLMGAQIGAEYALAGFEVVLVNRSPAAGEGALERARSAIRYLAAAALVDQERAAQALKRIGFSDRLEEACAGAEVVVESVAENLELKIEVLARAAAAAPAAILASNTSSIPIEAMGAGTGAGERMIGTHYWNPPTLMPLVEVIPGPATAPEVVERVLALLAAMGKEPVRVADIPGFAWNRLQLALVREAVSLVARGAATPEAIDLILRHGLGRRWSQVGPFETMALGGRETFVRIAGFLYPELDHGLAPEAILEVPPPPPEQLARARERRDAALVRFLLEDRKGRSEPPDPG